MVKNAHWIHVLDGLKSEAYYVFDAYGYSYMWYVYTNTGVMCITNKWKGLCVAKTLLHMNTFVVICILRENVLNIGSDTDLDLVGLYICNCI